eukprot:TRINITY_DN11572_c0_g1_i1.p3 TRINITY_DN11572_c0_g1~~TRINITY_DN11572_c0_g1_i1.p3  ORF type:complete len:176 (+),score=37.97 TRINITY_DN11572_c0_g1_i1:1852-2379(+)
MNTGYSLVGTINLKTTVWGVIPAELTLTNLRFLPINQACRIKFASNQVADKRLDVEPCAAVPIGAKGLLTTIHTYANGHHDHVCHSFGRNAAHSDFVADNAPYTLPDEEAWLNDVLITSEGDDSVTYYYGYFHGTQLIPLKANGRFDAVLNLHRNSNSIGGTLHEIVLLVVGYIV